MLKLEGCFLLKEILFNFNNKIAQELPLLFRTVIILKSRTPPPPPPLMFKTNCIRVRIKPHITKILVYKVAAASQNKL
jgi:hypothetical protein